MADIDYFDHRVLTGVINKRPLQSDIFASFFRRNQPSASELFELHVKTRNITMLPAISNAASGTMRSGDVVTAGVVKAPRFRPKRAFMASDRFKTAAGVTPYDPNENSTERAIAEDMDLHRAEIDYATEIMCQQAMVKGKVTLYDQVDGGKAVPQFTVDYKRPAEHTVALSGGALWSAAGSDLNGHVEEWSLMIQQETNGAPGTDLLLGKNAWSVFRRHDDVRKELDNRHIDIGDLAPRVAKKLKGVWNGLNIWTISGSYIDLNGVVCPLLDSNCALLLTNLAESVIEFGLPVDLECAGPVEIFAKGFEQKDPSGMFTIAESRPLAWTKQPGWTVYAQVV